MTLNVYKKLIKDSIKYQVELLNTFGYFVFNRGKITFFTFRVF